MEHLPLSIRTDYARLQADGPKLCPEWSVFFESFLRRMDSIIGEAIRSALDREAGSSPSGRTGASDPASAPSVELPGFLAEIKQAIDLNRLETSKLIDRIAMLEASQTEQGGGIAGGSGRFPSLSSEMSHESVPMDVCTDLPLQRTVPAWMANTKRRARDQGCIVLVGLSEEAGEGDAVGCDDVRRILDGCKDVIEVNELRRTRDNSKVEVVTGSYADAARLALAVSERPEMKLSTSSPEEPSVRFILRGLETSKSEVELAANIARFSGQVLDGELLAVEVIRPQAWDGRKNAIISAKGDLAKRLRQLNWIRADHRNVRISEYVSLLQCFHCTRYGHKARAPGGAGCRQAECCVNCAGSHSKNECPDKESPKKWRCAVCIAAGCPSDLVGHRANSGLCPTRRQILADCKHGL